MTVLNVLDLFCGCGGMSYGLKQSGLNIIAGIDIWKEAIDNYKKNFNHMGICKDLTQLSPQEFNEKYNTQNKVIDILTNTAPCQGFSISGRRDVNDPRNSLFMEFIKYLNYFKPKAFIIENVIGILSMKNQEGEKVIDIIMSLVNINYNCCINKLYASDFGAPQNRRRVIILGIRKDLNKVPEPIKPIIENIEDRIPISQILEPQQDIEQNYYLSERAILGIINKKQKSLEEGKGFGAQFANLDKPSYTIPARYWKDGYDCLIKYNESTIRRLTILELKRIQSFPDNYILEGKKKDIIMQIGNAVACKMAYHIGLYIKNILQ